MNRPVAPLPASAVRIVASYRLGSRLAEAPALAERIAWEQTVELPVGSLDARTLREEVIGEVLSVEALDEDACLATIGYPVAAEHARLPQLLNLLFGNVSLVPGVRLLDVELPETLLAALSGPLYGIEGVRGLLGVHARPLLATALKPRGLAREQLAAIAGDFARGGGDIVKDDQNLSPDDFEAFRAHLLAVRDAVARGNDHSARECLYFPHVAGPLHELERRFALVARLGLRGVLACPMLLGIDTTRELAARHGLVLMAHPALAGSYTNNTDGGIAHGLLLGTLFRLAGADIGIFPNHGGRFSFSRAQCMDISTRLRAALGGVRPALPCPAGGMSLERAADMANDYGADAVWLVGGALLGDEAGVEHGTRRYVEAIGAHFEAQTSPPRAPQLLVRVAPAPGEEPQVLPLTEAFEWIGRETHAYKDDEALPFRGMKRVELVGRHGERTAFNLRYFEVAPGGWSSLEKHLHAHAVIAARGRGVLVMGERRVELKAHDVAYIASMTVHQLRNESDQPFGFYCIVDRHRDRPMPPGA